MGSQRPKNRSSGASLSLKTGNKLKRKQIFIEQKKDKDKKQREVRFRRKKEEDKDPELRESRLAKNQPQTLETKRVWDDVDDDSLGAQVDVQALKKRRIEEAERAEIEAAEAADAISDDDDDNDSMLASDNEDEEARQEALERQREKRAQRDDSAAPSTTSTNLDLTPSSLYTKFPTLFTDVPPPTPKVLLTTSLNSTLHSEAELFCALFPNSTYIRRTNHRYGHKYSLREISRFAANREYTAVVMLREDQKQITGLTIVHLPSGPTFTFSVTNFTEGSKLPGHGNPTNHYPELLLNNFKTPLGLLTAKLFQTL